jgi:N-acetylmuramoyl-L-alanine amidase
VFALSEHGATSAAARWLAQHENEADLIGGVNLDNRDRVLVQTLLDLSQTAQINDSLRVGRSVLDGIGAVNALHKGSVEQAGFAVLKAPDIRRSWSRRIHFESGRGTEAQERPASTAVRRVDFGGEALLA